MTHKRFAKKTWLSGLVKKNFNDDTMRKHGVLKSKFDIMRQEKRKGVVY